MERAAAICCPAVDYVFWPRAIPARAAWRELLPSGVYSHGLAPAIDCACSGEYALSTAEPCRARLVVGGVTPEGLRGAKGHVAACHDGAGAHIAGPWKGT